MSNFHSNKTAVLSEMERAKAACLEALGMEFTHHAVKNIHDRGHVVTGDMSRAQTHQVDLQNSQVIVGNSMPYAVFVEMGTVRQDASNFMRDAFNDHQGDYDRIVKSILGDGFK